MNVHPLAELFPMLDEAAFEELTDDIRRNGLHQPIWLHQGQILDGRNRHLACLAAGVEPRFTVYEGDDPLGFVLSLNLKRRHLNESQRALVAARLATLEQGQRADRVDGSIDLSTAARTLNVSTPTVRRARKVLHDGAPEILAAVERGEFTASDAAAVSARAHCEQVETLARARQGEGKLRKAVLEIDRERQYAAIASAPPSFPQGAFEVIVLDPPWQYDNRYDPDYQRGAAIYATMSLSEIATLPIAELAAEDCVLWLWTTNHFLEPAFSLVGAWNFEYRNLLTWVKPMGVGRWLRNSTEHCLLASRGKPFWHNPNYRSHLIAPRREHSRKPDAFFDMVEVLCPGRRLDFFSREPREGWVQYGDQPDAFAQPPVPGT